MSIEEKMNKYWVQYVCEIDNRNPSMRFGAVEIPGLIINDTDIERLERAVKDQHSDKELAVQLARKIWIAAFSRFDVECADD